MSLKVESAHARYLPGEDVVVMVTIGNPGPANIEAPATYWSARMILDGKEYGRLPKFIGNWNGPGVIIPSGWYRGGITLAEYGVEPSSIDAGDHKLSLRIGDETSNELAFSIRAENAKLSIKIATEHTAVAGADDIRLEVTLKNLDTERISLPWVYGATRVILDGKEKGPLGFAIDRGPAAIEPNGEFRTSQSLALGTLAQGDHTIALQIGDAQSNKLALTVRGSDAADVAPASGQVQAPLAPRYGVQRIDPSMLENKTWLELKKKLETSGMQYRWVEVNEKGECRLDLSVTSTSDLSPLKGAPITYLDASHTAVRDLSPLAGMPLTVLDLSGSQVQDLSPLKGMRLTMLRISGTRVKDLSPLTEAKLIQLTATSTAIADLSPLAEMPLDYLDIRSTAVTVLAPLVKTPLSVLQIEGCKVKDLTPLRNTPVRTLTLTGFDGLDLSQLQGTRLTRMTLSGKEIKDLAPLHGMKFESLSIVETGVKDISALAGMPLTELDLRDSPVADLSPLKGMRLVSVYLSEPGADLAPLAGMPLELISLPRGADVKNIDVVRAMKTLKWIRTVEIGKPIPAADFWRMYDAGELKGQKAVSQDATTVLPRADQANQDMVPAAGLEMEVIRVLRLDSTLECDLNGICKNVAHRPRHGILSPDGKRIVYEHQDNDMVQLFVAQADGTQQRKLTKQNGKEYSPSWSADSERIAFVSDSPEKLQIHAINVDGSNHEQLTAHDQGAGLPKFGRDVSLAYLMWRQPLGKGRLSDLVVMQGKESKTIVTNQRVDDFAWSLDGRSLAIGKDGELVFHEIETGLDKSITFKEVNKGLDYHAARCITWNPAGDAIVCRIEATGGRKAGGPVLAGDEDVFIIPREGKPRAFSIGKTQADTPPKAGDSPHSLLVMELQWVRRSSNPATSALGPAQ